MAPDEILSARAWMLKMKKQMDGYMERRNHENRSPKYTQQESREKAERGKLADK